MKYEINYAILLLMDQFVIDFKVVDYEIKPRQVATVQLNRTSNVTLS